MSHKILAFAGSSSTTSINKQLITYTLSLFNASNQKEILDLNDYPLPILSVDILKKDGVPTLAKLVFDKIQSASILVLSLAEHNGAYSAVFKNLFDWISRVDAASCFKGPKILLMSTSPGARGGATVLEIAKNRLPYHGGDVQHVFSLPNFSDNFQNGKIITESYNNTLIKIVEQMEG